LVPNLGTVGVTAPNCTIPRGHTPPGAATHRQRGFANISCFVRPQGPLLRPDLLSPMTAAAGRGKDRRRRPATVGAQCPCGGLLLRSHSLKEGPLPDRQNNLRSIDS